MGIAACGLCVTCPLCHGDAQMGKWRHRGGQGRDSLLFVPGMLRWEKRLFPKDFGLPVLTSSVVAL